MLKRKRHVGLAVLVVLSLGGIVFFLKPKAENREPINIYRAVTPTPKTAPTTETKAEKTSIAAQDRHEYDHSHEHSYETVPHSHAEEMNTNSSEYDWRDDSAFDVTLPKSDPWQQNHPDSEPTDAVDNIYPPRDWYKTEDPELFAEYFRAQLIKQFGDRPEIHILADTEIKKRQGIPFTRDEYINFLEAQYSLFPDKRTLKTLERQQQEKAAGIPFVMIYSEPGETVEEKIQRFLKRRQEIEEEKAEKNEVEAEEVHELNE